MNLKEATLQELQEMLRVLNDLAKSEHAHAMYKPHKEKPKQKTYTEIKAMKENYLKKIDKINAEILSRIESI